MVKERVFWHDNWCSPYPLASIFPQLYEAATTKRSTVANNFFMEMEGPDKWFLGIDTTVAQLEALQVSSLLALLQGTLLNEGEDRLFWRDDSDIFTVKLCYKKLWDDKITVF